MGEPVWDHSTLAKNRNRLIQAGVARAFFGRIKTPAEAADLLSADHFTVDGSLMEAWASLKSFRPKGEPMTAAIGGRNPEVDFRGERHTNATQASTTAPQARLFTKNPGQTAKLSYMGHVLIEGPHGEVGKPNSAMMRITSLNKSPC